MGKRHKDLKEILPLMIDQFKKNNLTLNEVAESSKVDIHFLESLLDKENPTLSNLSRLLQFANIKCSFRVYGMSSHTHYTFPDYISIKRHIEPKCSVKFDFATQNYYDLNPAQAHQRLSFTQKQNVMHDFERYKENRIDRKIK